MSFGAIQLTSAALQAINTVTASGGTLNFSYVEVGSGFATGSDNPANFTALKNPVMEAYPTSVNTDVLYQTTIRADVSSANAPSEFQLNEIGIFYSLNGATPFLFGYTSTGAANGDTITPSSGSSAVVKDFALPIVYSTAVPVGTDVTFTTQVQLHASTHLPTGIDPLPISTSSVGGLCPRTNNNQAQVLLGGATASFGTLPNHAPTHLDTGTDPIAVATTTHTGLLPRLSGDSNTVLLGTGSWGAGFFPGFIADYGGQYPPAGWLLCDGQPYSRAAYSALYSALGGASSPWGQGNGSTTFNVPDLRGRTSIGTGQGSGLSYRALGLTGGEENHVLSVSELAYHTHGINDPGHGHSVYDPQHAHAVYDPQHSHGVYDPSHNHAISQSAHGHGVSDPGHTHRIVNPIGQGLTYQQGAGAGVNIYNPLGSTDTVIASTGIAIYASNANINISPSTANIGIYTAATNISIYNSATGIGIYGSGTGISIQYTGSNAGHNTMQPFAVVTKIIKT